MSKWKPRAAFAKVFCVGARSLVIVALYLAAFLAALQLATILPEPWSTLGITALVLVTGLSLRGKWSARRFRLESVGLGYQPDGQPNPQRANLAGNRGNRAESATDGTFSYITFQHFRN